VPLSAKVAALSPPRPEDAEPRRLVFPTGTGMPLSYPNVYNRVLRPALVEAGIAIKLGEDEKGRPVYEYLPQGARVSRLPPRLPDHPARRRKDSGAGPGVAAGLATDHNHERRTRGSPNVGWAAPMSSTRWSVLGHCGATPGRRTTCRSSTATNKLSRRVETAPRPTLTRLPALGDSGRLANTSIVASPAAESPP
jgi:hypothetical protein